MSKATCPTFRIVIRPEPNDFDPTGYRRLRAALKNLLRGYGIRCCTFEPVTPEDLAAADKAVREKTEAQL